MSLSTTEDLGLSWVVFAEEEPDDARCEATENDRPCTRQPCWSVQFGRDCGCHDEGPMVLCDPHKDFVLAGTIECNFCGGPVYIVSVERL